MRVPAWQGDWEKRINERVLQRGFHSVTAFADSRPTATLMQLADELGPRDDVAAFQLECLLRDEARQAKQVHRFARATLVRKIHEYFPQGWMRADRPSPGPSSPNEWCRASVFAEWSTGIGEEHDAATDRVWDSLKKTAPVGWLPMGPDDPIIIQAFREGQFPEDSDGGQRGETGGPV